MMKRLVRIIASVVVVLGMFANVGIAAEMKTVVIDIFPLESFRVSASDHIVVALASAGFIEGQNLVIHRLSDPNVDADITRVRQLQPDVIVVLSAGYRFLEPFRGTSTPVLLNGGMESLVDSNGQPRDNISGLYSTLQDLVYNSYKFLRKVAPLKPGQQAVYLDNASFNLILKKEVAEALQRLQIPLKTVIDTTVYEDFQAAILQYNEDPDVGWILIETGPAVNRDGTPADLYTSLSWQTEHLKKPSITYWEIGVQAGILAGFGIDFDDLGTQLGEMAARVLNGEDIKTIKAEYPRKVKIALNRKTATKLGIVFSLDVLKLANVIFDDYEGKQVIRK